MRGVIVGMEWREGEVEKGVKRQKKDQAGKKKEKKNNKPAFAIERPSRDCTLI